ncbi:MAG TPA: NAD(P)-binding domain-containing protein [Polyangiaceae bacterium]|nr:NAD(P)-binding domain-containing protein [Polyangiaceae bacterium]
MSPYLFVVWIVLLALLIHLLASHYEARRERALKHQAEELAAVGDVVPPTLHPRIDPLRCIGSGACVNACPEKNVLGVIQGRAHLINAMSCVGHGACATACPDKAIELVFGTRSRGVELPRLDANFQTSQPGIYIVGELGGMGLIRNAILQGAGAAEHIIQVSNRRAPRLRPETSFDALVVGAGPAGISATLKLMEAGLSVLLVDQEDFGGTILHYPRAKIVMTGDLPLPIYGVVRRSTMPKEKLLELFSELRRRLRIPFQSHQRVVGLEPESEGMWLVRSESHVIRAANVVLALGTRGSPRKLGVPGEELAKVHYRLLEPREFAGRDVLVVGGGNSAVESALSLADAGCCASVALSYRRQHFVRCRGDNRQRIDVAIREGRVRALMPTQVVRIAERHVTITTAQLASGREAQYDLKNDAVIAQLGGTSPADVLKSFGIELMTKYGER